MPYYSWQGIDYFGNLHAGQELARSKLELEKLLLTREIGILSSKPVIHKSLFKPIGLTQKVHFFKELSILVDSGILLPNSLTVIKQQIASTKLKMLVEEIEFEIKEGGSLAEIMDRFPYVFDYLTTQILKAGEESGNLGESLILLSEYLERKEEFTQKLKSVILLPTITLSIFIFIALIIFLFIIPSFVTIFQSSHQEMSEITKRLFSISLFLRNNGLLFVSCSAISFVFITKKIFSLNKSRLYMDKFLVKVPFIRSIAKNRNLTYFLQSVSLLLSGGIHLVKALEITCNQIKNEYLKKFFLDLYYSIQSGHLLSEAMLLNNRSNLFHPNLIAIVKVGEETGNLNLMLKKASQMYFEKSNRLLSIFLTIVQPALMIILGILIAFLIFAVYIPLFNLPNVIQY